MPSTKFSGTPKMVALDSATLNPGDLSWDEIAKLGQFRDYPYTREEEIVERSVEADILLVNKVLIGEEVLQQLPGLKCICVTATGYNNIDLDAASAQGIPVCNAVGYSTDSVAQHVMALILAMFNRVKEHDQSIKSGEWSAQPHFSYTLHTIPELSSKVMGIYGFGKIGQRVGELARAFGMKVLATHKHPERDAREWVQFVDLPTLFAKSDIVSLHAPLTDENREIVDLKLLKEMSPDAYLVNTGRGGLIKEADLSRALEQKILAGAALDVLSQEPPASDNPLLRAPNCWITPHIAWATAASRQRLMDITCENIRAFLEGNPQNVVNPE
jgi:glycerate dehydrogenase